MDSLSGQLPNAYYPNAQVIIGLSSSGSVDPSLLLSDITQTIQPPLSVPQNATLTVSGELTFSLDTTIDVTNNQLVIKFLPMLADCQTNMLGAIPTCDDSDNAIHAPGFAPVIYKAHFLAGCYYQQSPFVGGSYIGMGVIAAPLSTRTNMIDSWVQHNMLFGGGTLGNDYLVQTCYDPSPIGAWPANATTLPPQVENIALPGQYRLMTPDGHIAPTVTTVQSLRANSIVCKLDAIDYNHFQSMDTHELFACDPQHLPLTFTTPILGPMDPIIARSVLSAQIGILNTDPACAQQINTSGIDNPMSSKAGVYCIAGLIPFPARHLCPDRISHTSTFQFPIQNGPQTYNPETYYPEITPTLSNMISNTQVLYDPHYAFDHAFMSSLPLNQANYRRLYLQPGNFYLPFIPPPATTLLPTHVRSTHDHNPNMLSGWWGSGASKVNVLDQGSTDPQSSMAYSSSYPYRTPNANNQSNWSESIIYGTLPPYGANGPLTHELQSMPYQWYSPPMFMRLNLDQVMAPVGVRAGGPTFYGTLSDTWGSGFQGNIISCADINMLAWGDQNWIYSDTLSPPWSDNASWANAFKLYAFGPNQLLESTALLGRWTFECLQTQFAINPNDQMAIDFDVTERCRQNPIYIANFSIDTYIGRGVSTSTMVSPTGQLSFLGKPGRTMCGSNWSYAPFASRHPFQELDVYTRTKYVASAVQASELATTSSHSAWVNGSPTGMAPASTAPLKPLTYWNLIPSNMSPQLVQPIFQSVGYNSTGAILNHNNGPMPGAMSTGGNLRTNARHVVLGGYMNGFVWNNQTKAYDQPWEVTLSITIPPARYQQAELLLYINQSLQDAQSANVKMTSNLRTWNDEPYPLQGVAQHIEFKEDMDIVWTNCGVLDITSKRFPPHITSDSFDDPDGFMDNYGTQLDTPPQKIPERHPLPPEFFATPYTGTRPVKVARMSVSAVTSQLSVSLVDGYYVVSNAFSSYYAPPVASAQTFTPGMQGISISTGSYARAVSDFPVIYSQAQPITRYVTPPNIDWSSFYNCWPSALDFHNLSGVLRGFNVGQFSLDYINSPEVRVMLDTAGPSIVCYPYSNYSSEITQCSVFNPLGQMVCQGLSTVVITSISGSFATFVGLNGTYFKPSTISVQFSEGSRYGTNIVPNNEGTWTYEESPRWHYDPDAFIALSPNEFDSIAWSDQFLTSTPELSYQYSRITSCVTLGSSLLSSRSMMNAGMIGYDICPGTHRYQSDQNVANAAVAGSDSQSTQRSWAYDALCNTTWEYDQAWFLSPFCGCGWINERLQPMWPPPTTTHCPQMDRIQYENNMKFGINCDRTGQIMNGLDISNYNLSIRANWDCDYSYTNSGTPLGIPAWSPISHNASLTHWNDSAYNYGYFGTADATVVSTQLVREANASWSTTGGITASASIPTLFWVPPFVNVPMVYDYASITPAGLSSTTYAQNYTLARGAVPREAGRTLSYGSRNNKLLNSSCTDPDYLSANNSSLNVFMGEDSLGLTYGPYCFTTSSNYYVDAVTNMSPKLSPDPSTFAEDQANMFRSTPQCNPLPAVWNWGDFALPALPTVIPHQNLNVTSDLSFNSSPFNILTIPTPNSWQASTGAISTSCSMLNPLEGIIGCRGYRIARANLQFLEQTAIPKLTSFNEYGVKLTVYEAIGSLGDALVDIGDFLSRPICNYEVMDSGPWGGSINTSYLQSERTNIGLGTTDKSKFFARFGNFDGPSGTFNASKPNVRFAYPDGVSNGNSPANYYLLEYQLETETTQANISTYISQTSPLIRSGRNGATLSKLYEFQGQTVQNAPTQRANLGILVSKQRLSIQDIHGATFVVLTPYIAFGQLAAFRNNADSVKSLGVYGRPCDAQLAALGVITSDNRVNRLPLPDSILMPQKMRQYWLDRHRIMRERATYGPFYFVENHEPNYQQGVQITSLANVSALNPQATMSQVQYHESFLHSGPSVFPLNQALNQDPTSPLMIANPVFTKLPAKQVAPQALAMATLKFTAEGLTLHSSAYYNGIRSLNKIPIQLYYENTMAGNMATFTVTSKVVSSTLLSQFRAELVDITGRPLNLSSVNITVTIDPNLPLPTMALSGAANDSFQLTEGDMRNVSSEATNFVNKRIQKTKLGDVQKARVNPEDVVRTAKTEEEEIAEAKEAATAKAKQVPLTDPKKTTSAPNAKAKQVPLTDPKKTTSAPNATSSSSKKT